MAVVAAAAVALGCGGSAPANPTWAEDVAPILAANCVRCHGATPIGGAPDGFRLDSYDDIQLDDGRVIRGAASMAQFIAQRVAVEVGFGEAVSPNPTPMPPAYGEYGFAELDDRQIETLTNWAELIDQVTGLGPRGAPRSDNQPPVITLELSGTPVDGVLTIPYEIRDPDRDIVVGSFDVTRGGVTTVLTRELHSGRGEIQWDIAAFVDGDYTLTVTLDDGNGPISAALEQDSFNVNHGGNLAPRVTIARPRKDDILADADGLGVLEVVLDDPDTDPSLVSLTARARLGDQVVTIAEIDGTLVNGLNVIDWDRTGLEESGRWEIEVEVVSDGTTRIARIERFTISHEVTTEDFASVSAIFSAHCFCHGVAPSPFAPGVELNLSDHASVDQFRGLILRRVVQERTMPPQSYLAPGVPPPSQAELDQLANWLRGGAPEGATP